MTDGPPLSVREQRILAEIENELGGDRVLLAELATMRVAPATVRERLTGLMTRAPAPVLSALVLASLWLALLAGDTGKGSAFGYCCVLWVPTLAMLCGRCRTWWHARGSSGRRTER
ncbi:hypothetical protein OHV05_14735 [Kitasatospora sp. NBC_00070]|uniref:hypothetical protein n=1 Tax=Kitasatospora sp. NBC_00070 TaxID=2975962 RepID=UPI00324D7B7A